MITGDNGILTQAQKAKEKNIESTAEDKVKLEVLGSYDKNVKLDAETVATNLRSNIGAEVNPTVGDEDKFPLKATVDGVELIVDYDGDVRKPVTNPYDKDGWDYAWVCVDEVWKGKNETGDEPYTISDIEIVQEVEDGEIVAKFYKQSDDTYHLVIEGTGKMGAIADIEDATYNAWLNQFFTNTGNADVLLPYVTEAYICDGIENVGVGCLTFGTSINKVSIGYTITSIEGTAFAMCSELANIKIPSSVEDIGDAVFLGCENLTSITIPNSATSIGESVFSGCTGLTSITISNRVTSIGENVFEGCTGLTNITIPNGVTSLVRYVFNGCENLTSITIPNSVTSIGDNVFNGCTILTSITYKGTIENWNNKVTKNDYWNDGASIEKVICTDGEIIIE